ncbi:MAG TPA: hypothetical protein VNJ54_08575 [Plantibacter sp.]|uniref:hypothetical protein n=1 Tax=unclassified Plantibacter TaxID=2624265 RepID=UPI002CCFB1EC|nr:hypothetical protein [Plantibacter sp.]
MSATVLTACASTGGAEKPSGEPTSLEGGGGVSNSTFDQEVAAWNEKFDSCLRDQGIDVPKRTPGETPNFADFGVDEKTYKAAAAVCSKEVGPVPVDPSVPSNDEQYQMQLTFAKCMRDAGYEWDDPAPPSEAGSAGVKPLDPGKFDQKDLDACAVKAGLDSGSGNG